MHSVTKASIAYVATQTWFTLTSAQVFSCTDLVTDSEHFYTSILELLDDPEEKEVDQLLIWWNRQVFPLYAELKCIPAKDSGKDRKHRRQKSCNYREKKNEDKEVDEAGEEREDALGALVEAIMGFTNQYREEWRAAAEYREIMTLELTGV
ncbi:hypothetical protein PAXINDRAFT_18565 [Paxillus involutus ATCC 200175]|uniref:Uncharacterized protein n=1 Tax=Paxillus involutus ATCC 200175 TaxID=664439 RepID=A0A0C9SNP6_PAXIN|nr:hypothetical protein PAXINDRAFT_18565 [Paxillus involutus ATCC 200175]